MSQLVLKVKKLSPQAQLPRKANATDAGLDITATSFSIQEGYQVLGTDLAVEIPEGHVGLLFPRSSVAGRNLMLSNSVGVIDSGYRGEIKFKYKILNVDADLFKVGERIGQLVVIPIPLVAVEQVEHLSESDRGQGGYGSSGRF